MSVNFMIYFAEHFEQIIMNSTTLAALDICEVCGSFQCPYCQYYSSAITLVSYPLSMFVPSVLFCFLELSELFL